MIIYIINLSICGKYSIVNLSAKIDKYIMLDRILKELNLPHNAQKIFASLIEKGPSSARLISERLGIPRPSAYDNLNILIKHGLVTERDEGNKKVFSVDDIQTIPNLLQSKIDSLESEKASFINLLPSLLKKPLSLNQK